MFIHLIGDNVLKTRRCLTERAPSSTSKIFCTLIMFVSLAMFAQTAVAQQVPNIEKEDAPQQPKKRVSRTPVRSRGVAPRSKLIDVVIITELPGTNVALNGKTINAKNPARRISTKLVPQTYTVVTSGDGQPTKSFSITVTPERTMFNLGQIPTVDAQRASGSATASPVTPSSVAAAAAVTPPTNTSAAAAVPPLNALTNPEEVVNRYLDPQLNETIAADDWQKVEQVTTEALRTIQNPKLNGLKLFAQGQLAYLRKDYATAAVLFNNAKLAVPDSALVFYGLGNNLLATNQAATAISAYQRAVALNPQLALGYKGMGDAASKLGKTKEAFAHYNRARELGYASSGLNLEIARNNVRERRWQQALDTITPLLQKQPTAELFILLGDSYSGLKQPYSAMQAYLRATQINDKSAASFYKYGEMMFDLHEYAATIQAMERALALDTAGRDINRERAREYVIKANKALQKTRG